MIPGFAERKLKVYDWRICRVMQFEIQFTNGTDCIQWKLFGFDF